MSADTAAGPAQHPLPPALPLAEIDHVGIAVPDLDVAIDHWTRVLGGRLSHRETNARQGVHEAMIDFGAGARVQLLAPSRPDSTIARFLERRGPGLQQLAFRVPDVAEAMAAAGSAGLRCTDTEPRPGTAGSSVAFLHPGDTGGVLVELVQPAGPGHRPADGGLAPVGDTAPSVPGGTITP